MPRNRAEQRERNRSAVAEKEQLRAEREEALEAERQELEKLEGQAATIGEEHAATRAELAGLEERHRGERTAMGRLEQQFRETTARRNAIAPEIERLGEQRARLLANNIELDQRATLLAEQITGLEARVNEMAPQDAAHARGPARRRRRAEDPPRCVQEGRRSARRSKSNWSASRPS